MTPDPTHTLGAITPEYAEAGGDGLWLPVVMQEPMSNVIATEPDGYSIVLCHCEQGPYLGARKAGTPCRCERCGFMTREQWEALAAATRQAAAEAVLAEARNLCCGEHPSAHHAATDAHSRVMAIAERLADAARGLG